MVGQVETYIKVLLVEDDHDDSLLLREALIEGPRARFRVTHAQSLEEARKCLHKEEFDAALLDLSLPDSAWLNTLDALHTRHPDLPIIVLAGLDDETAALEALQLGAQDYLIKSKITPDALARCLRYAVERRRSERQLLESELNYRLLVEQATDAIVVFDLRANFVDANPQACEALGYTREELLRLNIRDVVPHEDRDRYPLYFPELLRGKIVNAERRLMRKDGSTFPVETNAKRLDDRRIQAIARDVTRRKEAEDALRLSEERYRTLLASLPQRIFFKDRDSVFVSVNDAYAKDIDVTPEQLTGKTDYDLHPKELADKYRADDRRVMRTRKPETLEEWNVIGERMRYVEVVKTPVIGDNGEVIGVLGMFTDITARKLAEDEVLRLNKELESRVEERTAQLTATNRTLEDEIAERKAVEKELEAFAYSVSHDLHAPLRAITGFSDALGEEYGERLDEQGQHYLGRIRSNAKRGGALIDDLLAFSRLGRQQIDRAAVNMTELALSVVEEIALNAAGRVPEIVVGKLPPASGDRALIHDVLVNLLSNAVKFTRGKDNPQIEIGGSTDGKENVYWVKDNGAGFDMRYASKLFGVFQRLHPPEEFEGTGVGLAIVQRIIHRHGGRVWAEGVVGEGATFYFSLMRET